MEPLVLALAIFFMLVIAVVLFQDPGRLVGEWLLERYAHTFDPTKNPNVKRRVTLIAPPQSINEERFPIVVEAQPLPTELSTLPNVKHLLAPIIQPAVYTRDGHRALNRFNPPLIVKAELMPTDGTAQLALVLLRKQGDNWQSQPLPRDEHEEAGEANVITGKLSTLARNSVIALAEV